MLHLVVFDFDGVIADSEPVHYEAFRQSLETDGIVVTWRDYCQRYLGYTDQEAVEHILADAGRAVTPVLVNAIVQRKSARFAQRLQEHCVILPGVVDLLDDLRAQGIARAICSGAQRHEVETVVEQAGLRPHFEVIVAAEDVRAGKPDPQGYLLSLQKINARRNGQMALAPQDCVVIEDSLWGIQAAKAARMPCLAVTTTYPANALELADEVAKDLTEVSVERLRRLAG
jgi:HAD superfamily hydrolase (TIGR01509 family)